MNLWIGALHHTTAAMRFGRSTALSQIALPTLLGLRHILLASAQQTSFTPNVVRQAERQDSKRK